MPEKSTFVPQLIISSTMENILQKNVLKPAAILLLADGTVYHGSAAGKIGTATGEICFNTGMTGYQEIFTDPSYYGQVMVATVAHIGNYGIRHAESESKGIQIAGFICKNFNVAYSRTRADQNIQTYFEENQLVAICDVDTRAIVRHIRDKGAMNCIISSEIFDLDELKKRLEAVPDMSGLELSSKVTTEKPYFLGNPNAKFKIAVYDYGVKKSILTNFIHRDCYVQVFPAKTPFAKVKAWQPDGYFLSNGPGDPSAMDYAVETVKQMLKTDTPVFGICLGHQLLALAVGVPTYKMHNGHRGINHPILNLQTGRGEITSQNHGFGVDPKTILQMADSIEVTHRNLNDDTIEGIRLKNKKAFSVQYHPEASPGPHDARYLFDSFLKMMEKAVVANT
jgi:carbamoyl-phosphate synthase small subunit